METYNRSEHIKMLHQERKENTLKRVNEAINTLLSRYEEVNFVTVSTESGVSRSTLYRNSEIKEAIEKAKANNSNAELLALKEQIARLTKENAELKNNIKEN